MSESNGDGILRIGKKGRKIVQFGDDPPEGVRIIVDVVAINNAYVELDRSFRDDKGEFQRERMEEYNLAKWAFAQKQIDRKMLAPASAGVTEEKLAEVRNSLSMAEAFHFLKVMVDEVDELTPFFRPKSAEKPSSQESSPTVVYSE